MKKLIIILGVLAFVIVSCNKQLKPASVIVIDPVRHYYPIIQGETMTVEFELENISDNPLFIQEIQTSCGCIVPRSELPLVILPHRNGYVSLDYNTIKNNGFVSHYAYCYGNFQDTTAILLQFDTNVVPSADYIRDYEELWTEQAKQSPTFRRIINSSTSQKGYYIESINNNAATEEEKPSIDYIIP
ncbi:MAG: DUF1573 domain-containing protein [Bacteroidaceae bacterium]|nr:DUF1573 domain-containing protein [Bacteroidaceae bacterium]